MPHFAAWFRRKDYQRIRQIMDDGDGFPPAFDEWEKLAKSQVAGAAAHGVVIKPVILDPDKFLTFCRERQIPCNAEARAIFSTQTGTAEGMN